MFRRRHLVRAVYLTASALLHAVAFVVATQIHLGSPASKRPVFDQFVRPKDHTVLYYRPPKVQAAAQPEERIGESEKPQAPTVARETAIARFPSPQSKQEVLWQPVELPEIKVDVPVPTVVARRELTALPPAPRAKAKEFKAPPPSQQTAALPQRAQPDVNLPSAAMSNTVPATPSISFSAAPAFPKDLPKAPEPSKGNADAAVALVSLNPSPNIETAPVGNRSGAFARAPIAGPTATGQGNPGAVTIPNVAVSEPVKPAAAPKNEILYAERVRASTASALSAPLRPSNRSIPRALEARFSGRNVFAVVIPIENMPAYSGDWILWFAELTPRAAVSPAIRAPQPYKKVEALGRKQSAPTRVQIAGVLGRDGRLRQASVLPPASSSFPVLSAEAQAWVLEDLAGWEFKPATQNGVAIEVDAVFEISFHLPQN